MNEQDSPQQLLQRILRAPLFRDSPDHASLLEYLCHQTQTGNLEALHEHDIGVALLGLEPGYDVTENPVVSRTADEVRERLKQHFTTDGRREPIRLVIPKGEFRAFFYEADPALVAADEPSGIDCFWAAHWQSATPTLLLHGEVPGDAIPIAEAYAATMIAMLFHKQDRRLEMRPASVVGEASLARRSVVVIGTADSNPLIERLRKAVPDTAVAERIAPTQDHGWVTLLTADSSDGILDAARYVVTADGLDRTLAEYGEGGFPPFFRLTITSAH